jgi:ABC-type glycerol-3-phosphate transport system substrate-binding protein
MLFYRKDILANLGITKENLSTWEGIYKVALPELQKNYLSFGLAPSITNYVMLLNQNGGQLYNQEGTQTLLNSSKAVTVFESFTRLYTEYLQPVSFDFANRFRTGQMPLAVMDFSAYNQLSVFAPEIAGLWEMVPLPATTRDDGTVDNSGVLNVSACVMFPYSQNKQDAWEFMKWWTSADVQTQYGKNMESIMGTAARYNSANLEAFQSVSWDENIRAAILEQSSNVLAIPEVPGGYYTSRYFDFAYRDVVNNAADVRSTLNKAVIQINSEIHNKREEFGLN